MNKVPVGQTIANAYGFTFGHVGSIIGLAWISLVAIAVLQFLPYATDGAAASANPAAAGQHAIQNFGISILVLLLFSIVYVAVTRLALGERQGGAMYHFAMGAPEFRTFGAVILLILVLIGIAISIALIVTAVAALASGIHNAALLGFLAFVAAAAIFCFFVFVAVRLGFLLVPVTVVEQHISLTRGWILTEGNFWRLLAILIAILLPLFILELIATAIVVGPELSALFVAGGHIDPQAFTANMEQIQARHAPVLIGIRLVFAPFQLGLTLSASAFAYRALVGSTRPS